MFQPSLPHIFTQLWKKGFNYAYFGQSLWHISNPQRNVLTCYSSPLLCVSQILHSWFVFIFEVVFIFEIVLSFNIVLILNNSFQMPVRGGHPPSICSQIQKCLNLIQDGGHHFSNTSEIQKYWIIWWGGESGLIGNFSQFVFLYLNFNASPSIMGSMLGLILGSILGFYIGFNIGLNIGFQYCILHAILHSVLGSILR